VQGGHLGYYATPKKTQLKGRFNLRKVQIIQLATELPEHR
jgi:hypothetical protein